MSAGEPIRVVASHDDISLTLDAPIDLPDEMAKANSGHIVLWPRVNALAYAPHLSPVHSTLMSRMRHLLSRFPT